MESNSLSASSGLVSKIDEKEWCWGCGGTGRGHISSCLPQFLQLRTKEAHADWWLRQETGQVGGKGLNGQSGSWE